MKSNAGLHSPPPARTESAVRLSVPDADAHAPAQAQDAPILTNPGTSRVGRPRSAKKHGSVERVLRTLTLGARRWDPV
jgi:hypothetical protein